jgi:galactokinase
MGLSYAELKSQLASTDSQLFSKIFSCYPINENLVKAKTILYQKLSSGTELFNDDDQVVLARAPARLSFSKHADYINASLLYTASQYETLALVSAHYTENNKNYPEHSKTNKHQRNIQISIINSKKAYQDFSGSFNLDNLLDITYLKKHFSLDWTFYVLAAINLSLLKAQKQTNHINKLSELKIFINSDLPEASGLSSSHALILSMLAALAKLFKFADWLEVFKARKLTNLNIIQDLINSAQSIEHHKGFKSGLGDQLAQLLAKKNQVVFIGQTYPVLSFRHLDLNDEIGLFTVSSGIKAAKTSHKFQKSAKFFERYAQVNQFAAENFQVGYLADCLKVVSHHEIAQKLLLLSKQDLQLAQLVLYGLSEAASTYKLSSGITLAELTRHLTRSHQAELVNSYESIASLLHFSKDVLTPSAEQLKTVMRLSEVADMTRFIEDFQNISQEADLKSKLDFSFYSGRYAASTISNDLIFYAAHLVKDIHAASLMGAGLGGQNLIICQQSKLYQSVKSIKNLLSRSSFKHKFYTHNASEGTCVLT